MDENDFASPPSRPRSATTDAILLALLLGILFVVAGGAWLVDRRIRRIEERLGEASTVVADAPRSPASPPARPADPRARPATLESLESDLSKLSDDAYQYYVDSSGDLHEMKRTLKQLQSQVRALEPAPMPGLGRGRWALPDLGREPTPEVVERLRADAGAFGVKVEPGRVEVPGFLNLAPNRAMPIEYFVTRWPVAGHETLVHVHGNVVLSDMTERKMHGLPTAIYKGLVAAGFRQGDSSRFEEGADPAEDGTPGKPVWIPPTGDWVHVGVRYALGGKTHVARASDWVVDPATGAVLPEESFRFTGSRRMEDPETGDETLSGEESGLVVSVYYAPASLVEIALPGNLSDQYQYNYARIPRPEGQEPLLLDLILSREPIRTEGDGARPLEKPVVEPPADLDPGSRPEGQEPSRDPTGSGPR